MSSKRTKHAALPSSSAAASSAAATTSKSTSSRIPGKRKAVARKSRHRADGNASDDGDHGHGNNDDDHDDSDDSDASDVEINLTAADNDDEQERMNVDFNFFDPKPIDQSYIRQLLARYTDTTPCDLGELSDVICRQASVGTVIKGDGSPYPLAFITAINLNRHKDLECVKQVKQFLIDNATGVVAQQMSVLFNDATQCVGLIIQERIANLPIELVPHLHKSLLDDLSWAVQNEISDAHRAQFKFDKIIMLTRAMRGSVAQSQGKKSKKQKQHHGNDKGSNTASAENTLYYRFEDDFYARNAEFAYKFPVAMTQAQQEKSDTVPEERVVLVIPFAGMTKVVKLIDGLCQEK